MTALEAFIGTRIGGMRKVVACMASVRPGRGRKSTRLLRLVATLSALRLPGGERARPAQSTTENSAWTSSEKFRARPDRPRLSPALVHIDRPIAPTPATSAIGESSLSSPALDCVAYPSKGPDSYRHRRLGSRSEAGARSRRFAWRRRLDLAGRETLARRLVDHRMTHVAINEAPTNWMDKVTDEQYEA